LSTLRTGDGDDVAQHHLDGQLSISVVLSVEGVALDEELREIALSGPCQ
jgi:hypothetical protein